MKLHREFLTKRHIRHTAKLHCYSELADSQLLDALKEQQVCYFQIDDRFISARTTCARFILAIEYTCQDRGLEFIPTLLAN